jgi:hypothetical protein
MADRLDLDWVGSFAYCPRVDDFMIDENLVHQDLIEMIEDRHPDDDLSWRDMACGWLYESKEKTTMFIQWSSMEASTGTMEEQDATEKKIGELYGKPVEETEYQLQWRSGHVGAENRAIGIWPAGYTWVTSWIYVPSLNQVLMYKQQKGHGEVVEKYEDETGTDLDLEGIHVGLILVNLKDQYVIYPEYSDWYRGLADGVPESDKAELEMVKAKAESLGFSIVGVLRGDSYDYDTGEEDPGRIFTLTKFKAKKPKRHHIRKREQPGFHHYDGIYLYIPEWYSPPQTPEGGQVDTTGKVAAGILIKFVSLPDKFLVGEDTHHLYLLEAEFGVGEFPSDTSAIGRAWLENDVITGIGFDFGNEQGQEHAIEQLREWAHKEGYETSPELQDDIRGLAKTQ